MGTVLRIPKSVFAPPAERLVFLRRGAFNVSVWRRSCTRHLRGLWRADPGACLTLIGWPPAGATSPWSTTFSGTRTTRPGGSQGTALRRIAKRRRDGALRRARRGRPARRVHVASGDA